MGVHIGSEERQRCVRTEVDTLANHEDEDEDEKDSRIVERHCVRLKWNSHIQM